MGIPFGTHRLHGAWARLVQPLPAPAHSLGQEGGPLPLLHPVGGVPDHLPQTARCDFTFWIGCKDVNKAEPSLNRQ